MNDKDARVMRMEVIPGEPESLKVLNGITTDDQMMEFIRTEFSRTCPAPWISLLAFASGEYAPCCFTMSHGSSLQSYDTLDDLWNSDYQRKMRRLVSEGRYREAGCMDSCTYFNGATEPPFEPATFTDNINSKFLKTPYLKEILKDFILRKQYVTSAPAIVNTILFNHCNLRCVMCPQDHDDKGRLSYESVSMLLSKPEYLTSWVALGGEVFADKRFSDYYSSLNINFTEYLKPVIFTNGLLLDKKNLSNITKHNMPTLLFSIDGATADTYNQIRVGSNFDTVMTNLKRAASFYRQKECKDRITWHYLIMKSTLEELEIANGICEELGIVFEIEKAMGFFPEENIFDFPYILADSSGVDIALRFLKGNKISNGYRKSSLVIELKEISAKLARLERFLSCPYHEAAGMLDDAEFAVEVANAASYGARKTDIAERLPEILLCVREIPVEAWSHYFVLLNFIPSGAKEKNNVFSHIKSLVPDRVSGGTGFDNSFRDGISVVELLYSMEVDSTANSVEIIHGMTRIMSPVTGDGAKGLMTGDEAMGASLLWGNPKLNGEGILYEFMDRYMDETVLEWDNVTASWRTLLYNLASWHESRGKAGEAVWLFERLLDLPDMDRLLLSGCHFHLACIAREAGDMDKARLSAGKCLMINPQHIAAAEMTANHKNENFSNWTDKHNKTIVPA